MKIFKNIKSAHEYYNYPGTYRHGTIYDETGVIRSYSNGTKDFFKNETFFYEIKDEHIKNKFLLNKKNKKSLRVFLKQNKIVYDLGLFKVYSFTTYKHKLYVQLIKSNKM